MSREIISIAIEAEESETARGGFRLSSPGRQHSLQGSFEEGPSGGLPSLAKADRTFAPLGETIWSQSTPRVGLGLLHSRSFHTPAGPTQPPTSSQLPCRRTFLDNCKAQCLLLPLTVQRMHSLPIQCLSQLPLHWFQYSPHTSCLQLRPLTPHRSHTAYT